MAVTGKGVTRKVLKKIPGFNTGVREGAALRMVKMAAPICPFSNKKTEELKPGEVNCQREQGGGVGWWQVCEDRGHDPYFSTLYRRIPKDKIEKDPETGEELIVGQVFVRVPEKRLNVRPTAVSMRHDSGISAIWAQQRKGRKRLEALGYEEVCQFRACQKPIKVRTEAYGDYCSERHARLIAANQEGITIEVENAQFHPKSKQKRNRQLREIELYGSDE